jgi:hypothetical protein
MKLQGFIDRIESSTAGRTVNALARVLQLLTANLAIALWQLNRCMIFSASLCDRLIWHRLATQQVADIRRRSGWCQWCMNPSAITSSPANDWEAGSDVPFDADRR